jgi:hypothetical protein
MVSRGIVNTAGYPSGRSRTFASLRLSCRPIRHANPSVAKCIGRQARIRGQRGPPSHRLRPTGPLASCGAAVHTKEGVGFRMHSPMDVVLAIVHTYVLL